MYTHTHTYIRFETGNRQALLHVYMYTHTHVYMYIYTSIYIHLNMYICTHTRIHTYTHTRTHTHTHMGGLGDSRRAVASTSVMPTCKASKNCTSACLREVFSLV